MQRFFSLFIALLFATALGLSPAFCATIASIGTRSATTATCSIAGTVATISGASGGTIRIGDQITGGTTSAQTYIQSFGTGTGGNGTYNVNNSQTVAACTTIDDAYNTIPSWSSGFLTGGWIGYMYNDAAYTITSDWNSQGNSTSSTDYMKLTAAPGQSFIDNAGVQSNPLRCDQTKGVEVDVNNNVTFMRPARFLTISRLQVCLGDGGFDFTGSGDLTYDQNILEWNGATSTVGYAFRDGTSGPRIWTNNTIIDRAGTGDTVFKSINGSGVVIANNTIVSEAASPGGSGAVDRLDSGDRSINNIFFGYSTLINTDASSTWSNTCTDKSSAPGSNNQVSKSAATQFVNAGGTGGSGSDGSRDFRLAGTGANCYNAGTADTMDIPGAIDIVNTSRPQSTSWDIGAWEYVASAPPPASTPQKTLLGVGQ